LSKVSCAFSQQKACGSCYARQPAAQAIRAALGEAWPVPLQNDLARSSLQNRGAAKVDGGDLAGAISDFDAAIALRQAIRRRPHLQRSLR
jgi:hypothetical protein